MRFLITGGAGFLGINLCRYLKERGHYVRSLDTAPFDYPDRRDYDVRTGDVRDKAAVSNAMNNIDVCVHAAMALPLYDEKDIRSVGVEGTRNVLDAAIENDVKRVVFVSSTAVYGIPKHHPLIESDVLQGVGPYGEAKIEAEMLCLAYRQNGLVIPILRPKTFIGPERLGVFAIYFDWVRRGKHVPIIGDGKNKYQLLDVDDLCQAILLAATKPASKANDTFNIGAGWVRTMNEDFGVVLRYAGTGRHLVPLPATPTIWTLRILEALKLSPLYKWVYETASVDSYVSIEKAQKQLGYRPRYSTAEALLRNYKWYILSSHAHNAATGISHRQPWKQGILRVVSWFF